MIHAVTDGSGLSVLTQEIICSISTDVDAICIREKKMAPAELLNKIAQLIDRGAPPEKLILHSSPELADVFPVQGVHFTEFDERLSAFKQAHPDKQAGRSVHSVASAQKAEADGADYLYFGHVFASKSKLGLAGRGLDALHKVAASVSVPVIAIGGIHPGNIPSVRQTGASGAAMISAFFN